jgi:hypothetical protein
MDKGLLRAAPGVLERISQDRLLAIVSRRFLTSRAKCLAPSPTAHYFNATILLRPERKTGREMPFVSQPWQASQLRAILFALVVLAWGPAAARAGCGDHVRFSEHANAQSLDSLPGSAPSHLPCTGPGCSRRQSPLPLTAVEPTATDPLGTRGVSLTDAPPARGFLVFSFPPDLPANPSRIFHPPRS